MVPGVVKSILGVGVSLMVFTSGRSWPNFRVKLYSNVLAMISALLSAEKTIPLGPTKWWVAGDLFSSVLLSLYIYFISGIIAVKEANPFVLSMDLQHQMYIGNFIV